MSGAQLVIRMDVSQAQSLFGRLAMAVSDTTPIMRAIGTGLVTSTQDRFEDEVDPDGAAWAPLNPDYLATKRGAGILRESAMRGGLQGSITYRAGRTDVAVGTNKVYGAIHQFGGDIQSRLVKTRSVTIPARPYLGISSEDRDMILDVVSGALDRAIGSGPSSAPPIR